MSIYSLFIQITESLLIFKNDTFFFFIPHLLLLLFSFIVKNKMSYPIGYSGREYLRCYGESYLHSEKIENDCYRIIECDLHYKTMIVKTLDSLEWEWKEMDLTELLKGDTIDMKENGCRW